MDGKHEAALKYIEEMKGLLKTIQAEKDLLETEASAFIHPLKKKEQS